MDVIASDVIIKLVSISHIMWTFIHLIYVLKW